MLEYRIELYPVLPWSRAELDALRLKMKNNPVLLILSALAAHAAGGAVSQMTLDRANASLHGYYPCARVWQEQLRFCIFVHAAPLRSL